MIIQRPRNPSIAFIETQMVIGEVLRHNQITDQFEPMSSRIDEENTIAAIWEEASVEKDALVEKMIAYQKKKGQIGSTARGVKSTQLSVNCSWDDAMAAILAAAASYGDNRPRSKFFRSLASIKNRSESVKHWLNLLPDGDYTGAIAGAFKMIAVAAQQSNELREDILQAMIEIPEHIDNARFYIEIYDKRTRAGKLIQGTRDLYVAIVRCLTFIMELLVRGKAYRALKAVVKGEAYGEDIKNAVHQVGLKAMRLRQHAEDLTKSDVGDVRKNVQRIVEQNQKSAQQTLEQTHKLDMVATMLYDFLNCQVKEMGANLLSQMASVDAPLLSPALSTREILQILEYDETIALNDVDLCRQLPGDLSTTSMNSAIWVAQSQALMMWLHGSTQSTSLLINGRRPDEGANRTSFLSFISATMVSSFSKLNSAIVVRYFCGLHDGDRMRGLLSNVLGQLVSQARCTEQRRSYHSVSDQEWDAIQNGNIDKACEVFETIVLGLNQRTMFICVIDNVAFLEEGHPAGIMDFYRFLETLQSIMNRRALVRVLLTATSQSDLADSGAIALDFVLDVPEFIDTGSDGIFAESLTTFGY